MDDKAPNTPIRISEKPNLIHDGSSSKLLKIRNIGPGAIWVGTKNVAYEHGLRLARDAIMTLTDEHTLIKWYGVREYEDDAYVEVTKVEDQPPITLGATPGEEGAFEDAHAGGWG